MDSSLGIDIFKPHYFLDTWQVGTQPPAIIFSCFQVPEQNTLISIILMVMFFCLAGINNLAREGTEGYHL